MIEAPMPIRTPRLILRPRQPGDEDETIAAVAETWNELHRWMAWAEDLADFTLEQQQARTQMVSEGFARREQFEFIGRQIDSGRMVVWTGFHQIDWSRQQCETGFWVRRSAHNQGFATEACNALLRYAFGALRMQRVGITHSAGNEQSRRVVEKLGFVPTGIEEGANHLPGGRIADRHCYVRTSLNNLPALEVSWG